MGIDQWPNDIWFPLLFLTFHFSNTPLHRVRYTSVRRIVMKSVTPVMIVEEIEPCVRFWKERMGFSVTAEVPEGDKLGFVILAKDGVQLMYQSWASVKKDVPALAVGDFRPGINPY